MTVVLGNDAFRRQEQLGERSALLAIRDQQAAEARRSGPAGRFDGLAVTVLKLLLVGAVALQRIQLPGGVPLTLVVLLAGAALLALLGSVVVSRLAVLGFFVATSLLALVAWIASQSSPRASMTSLLLLLLLYAPWVLRLRDSLRPAAPEVGRFFVHLAGFFGFVAAAQFLAQLAGAWVFTDYVAMLPENLQVPGYNPAALLEWGSSIYRPAAFVFLEPSMLSQTSALGILVGLVLRMRARALLGPVLGIASALSGTGIILLGAGLVLIVLVRPRLLRLSFVILGLVAILAVLASPAAGPLLSRSDEVGQSGSSGSLRFIEPYQQVLKGLAVEPSRVLIGAGPGTSERLLASSRGSATGQAVVYTIPAKLLFEYGAFAGMLFLAFVFAGLLRPAGIPLVGAFMFVMLMTLSGALLQPNTALLAWTLVVLWRRPASGRSLRAAGDDRDNRPSRQLRLGGLRSGGAWSDA